jgi:hypothetical protein
MWPIRVFVRIIHNINRGVVYLLLPSDEDLLIGRHLRSLEREVDGHSFILVTRFLLAPLPPLHISYLYPTIRIDSQNQSKIRTGILLLNEIILI